MMFWLHLNFDSQEALRSSGEAGAYQILGTDILKFVILLIL